MFIHSKRLESTIYLNVCNCLIQRNNETLFEKNFKGPWVSIMIKLLKRFHSCIFVSRGHLEQMDLANQEMPTTSLILTIIR